MGFMSLHGQYWKTKVGRYIPLRKMGNTHLQNALAMAKRMMDLYVASARRRDDYHTLRLEVERRLTYRIIIVETDYPEHYPNPKVEVELILKRLYQNATRDHVAKKPKGRRQSDTLSNL